MGLIKKGHHQNFLSNLKIRTLYGHPQYQGTEYFHTMTSRDSKLKIKNFRKLCKLNHFKRKFILR